MGPEMMHVLRKDVKDFSELALHFNVDAYLDQGDNASTFNDAASQKSVYSCSNSVSVHMSSALSTPNSTFYAVQRLLIQEKGEDTYYALAQQKRDQLLGLIRDRAHRRELGLNTSHFTVEKSEEMKELDAEGKWQRNIKLQYKRDESNVQAKVLKYQIGRSTTTIVNMLKNFLDDCEKIDEPV